MTMKELTSQQISDALALPKEAETSAIWEAVRAELIREDIYTVPGVVTALATINTECSFKNVIEHGAIAYFKQYEGRKDLGNIYPGDGFKYRGHGIGQLTGRNNYIKYGAILGLPLVDHPELLLDIRNGARQVVAYIKDHGMETWAARGHWWRCRKLYNGGFVGLVKFLMSVWKLLDLIYD